MPNQLIRTSEYRDWLKDVKQRVRQAQVKAAVQVNTALLTFYWELGADIAERQKSAQWGSGFLKQLSTDLMAEFPDMKGFSRANLMYMRAFAEAWPGAEIVQQAVGQLPWGHNLVLLTRLKDPQLRLAYAQRAIQQGWSRNVLNIQDRKSTRLNSSHVKRSRMPSSA